MKRKWALASAVYLLAGVSLPAQEAAIAPPEAMKQKPYWEMTTQEIDEATKQFDEPMVADKYRPLTPAEREQWKRVKGKRGRPKVGQGHKRVSVSLEQGLLERATALARKRRISRSKLLAQVLEQALAEEK